MQTCQFLFWLTTGCALSIFRWTNSDCLHMLTLCIMLSGMTALFFFGWTSHRLQIHAAKGFWSEACLACFDAGIVWWPETERDRDREMSIHAYRYTYISLDLYTCIYTHMYIMYTYIHIRIYIYAYDPPAHDAKDKCLGVEWCLCNGHVFCDWLLGHCLRSGSRDIIFWVMLGSLSTRNLHQTKQNQTTKQMYINIYIYIHVIVHTYSTICT